MIILPTSTSEFYNQIKHDALFTIDFNNESSAWRSILNTLNINIDSKQFSDHIDKHAYILSKLSSIVHNNDLIGDDEKSVDLKFRQAVRSWRSAFTLNQHERLVSFYSCNYQRNLVQGWMYISMQYLCFYSFVFGLETKVIIELKDIIVLQKEKSKRGLTNDGIKIKTIINDQEHFFSNLFQRDETFELLEHLVNLSMVKLLKSTSCDPAPGLSLDPPTKSNDDIVSTLVNPIKGLSLQKLNLFDNQQPLVLKLEHQKRNLKFCAEFSVPLTEELLEEMSAICSISGTTTTFQGKIYLSSHFLTFQSDIKHQFQLVIPFFTIKRVEKISSSTQTIALTLWHSMKIVIAFNNTTQGYSSSKTESLGVEKFLEVMKVKLREHVKLMKELRQFVQLCVSEDLLHDKEGSGNGGLGVKFGYLDMKKSEKEKQKLKYWVAYMKEYGRNLTIVRLPTFIKLVRIGLPNVLRGEVWEVCCGAIYKRYLNPGKYEKLHIDNHGKNSLSTEEIEKDLNRSLPEYPGFQTEEGINTLRRVLYAYSYYDPDIGYCQAMNLVVSLLLIYLTEEQAFWILTILVEHMLPGYYSVNMVGAVVDNHVFEALVDKFMPVLSAHIKKHDIQLSVACLPWFLSLFINTLPLVFALRVVDCFFMEGPKVLFQVGLAILKTNGEAIMNVKDDGELMNILKKYFLELGELVPNTDDQSKQITRFNELMLTAYREFQQVSSEMIIELRKTHQLKVVHMMDQYAKRSVVRNLNNKFKVLKKEQLLFICEKFFGVHYYRDDLEKIEAEKLGLDVVANEGRVSSTTTAKNGDKMGFEGFKRFIGKITRWGDLDLDLEMQLKRLSPEQKLKPIVGELFMSKLFNLFFDMKSGHMNDGLVSFEDVCVAIDNILAMSKNELVKWFFLLHDGDLDSRLEKEESIQLSESLLFLLRGEEEDKYLGSISGLMAQVFSLQPNISSPASTTIPPSSPKDANTPNPMLSCAVFKELIDTDEYLNWFFSEGFQKSFVLVAAVKVDLVEQIQVQPSVIGLMSRDIWSTMRWAGGGVPGGVVVANHNSVSGLPVQVGIKDKKVEVSDEISLGEDDSIMLEEVEQLLREAESLEVLTPSI